MFSWQNLLVGVLAGAVGCGYFIYGKKQRKLVCMVTGIALIVYPYLFSSLIVLILVGLALIPLPFFFRE